MFKLPYSGAMEIQQTISEAILNYSIMSKTDQLDLKTEDQDRSLTSAISRLSTFDDSESIEETKARTDKFEEIRIAVSLRNRLVKMHRCNKIVCINIMAFWGCLKIFTSENDRFPHQVQQIPMFDD